MFVALGDKNAGNVNKKSCPQAAALTFGRSTSDLPNRTRVLADHRLSIFAAECFPELGHVGYRSVDAPFRGRVRVTEDLKPLGFGCRLRCPSLRPSEEESLSGSEAIDLLRLLAVKIVHQGRVSDVQAA